MAAVCVQAIWTASAPSISSFGAAASIIARAALMWVSEMVPKGERAAACNCNSEALIYSVQDLLSDDFQFQAKESRMLQVNRPKPAAVVDSAIGVDVGIARYNLG